MANSAVVGLLRVLLTADTAEFDAAMKRVGSSAKTWSKDLGSIGRQATALGASLTKTLTLPIVAAGGAAAKAAVDFESSFAGVRKTIDATEPEFAALAQGFRNLAKEIPISVNELNRLGETAGALGIPKAEVLEFSRVMAQLGVTTNVTSDQAAESIAKIQTIFGAAGKDTERFASTLVELGNKGASTEQEILALATRIASAGNTIGLSQGQVLGWSSAIANVGMDAEAGGSAISRVFVDIANSVSKGGKELNNFAQIAGMSSAQFAKAFKDDASAATLAFVDGLGRIQAGGGDLIGTLNELGFTELRQADLLRRLAGSSDGLANSLNIQGQAWAANSALSEEARKRFETTASQLKLLWQRINDVGITLGNALLPVISRAVDLLGALMPVIDGVAHGFAALPEPVQTIIVALGAIAAAAGPVIFVLGQLATAASAIAAFFAPTGLLASGLSLFGTSLPAIGSAVAGFGTTLVALATGPIGIAIGAVAALTTVWLVWGEDIKRIVVDVYTTVKTWLLDKFGPVFDSIGGLLSAVGDMFAAFGKLVGAVAMKVIEYAADLFKGVKTWLLDKMKPVLDPLGKMITAIATVFGVVKDKVVNFARALYEGVKLYLITRFTSIVDGIKQKIEAVTRFFNDMYEAVVGNSIVPDMVDGIEREFERLGDVMVEPARAATGQVRDTFRDMLRDIDRQFSSWGASIGGKIQNLIGGPIGGALGGVAGKLVSGLGSIITGGVDQLVSMALQLAVEGLKWLGGKIWDGLQALGGWLFGGGPLTEERRNELIERGKLIGPSERRSPPGSLSSGFAVPKLGMGGIVTQPQLAMIGERGPEAVIPLSPGTSSMGHDAAAPRVTAEVHIHAWDGTDVQRVVMGRDFAEALARAVGLNTHGIGTAVRSAL